MLLREMFATIGIAGRNLLLYFISIFFLLWQALTYLKEEYEADPLVVCVVFLGILIVEIIGNTRMSYFTADLCVKGREKGNCIRQSKEL